MFDKLVNDFVSKEQQDKLKDLGSKAAGMAKTAMSSVNDQIDKYNKEKSRRGYRALSYFGALVAMNICYFNLDFGVMLSILFWIANLSIAALFGYFFFTYAVMEFNKQAIISKFETATSLGGKIGMVGEAIRDEIVDKARNIKEEKK